MSYHLKLNFRIYFLEYSKFNILFSDCIATLHIDKITILLSKSNIYLINFMFGFCIYD